MITEIMIQKTLDEIESIPDDEISRISDQFGEEQPFLMAYILAVCESSDFEPEEQEMFFFIGLVLWRVNRSSRPKHYMISEEDIDAATSANDKMLSSLEEDSPGDFLAAVLQNTDEYPEPALLKFILESIFESDEENEQPTIDEENSGTVFYHLKIVLDALIRPSMRP